jgi:deoxycytidine triphosphate deaminase
LLSQTSLTLIVLERMYLTDTEILTRLSELDIVTGNPAIPFDPDGQIQPCSIDLRLSPVYWQYIGRAPVDLRMSHLRELNPRRHWKRRELGAGEALTLKSSDIVLCRIYECLTIPPDCAGALEGRSSFARMGLSVHATGGFINPGWRGHMPLTLINSGKATLKIPAHTPICQLMLVKLSGPPARLYGDESLASKYMDDDGGPSYWWRDKMLRKILSDMGLHELGQDMQERLLRRIGVPSDSVLESLELLVQSKPYGAFANSDELLEVFVQREDRQRMYDTILRNVARGAFPLMLTASLASLFAQPIGILHYVIWGLTLLTIPVSWLGVKSTPREYLGRKELEAIDRRRLVSEIHN